MSRLKVVRWAVLSRVCLLALQLLANNLIPDHEGSMNDVFMKDMRTPPHSTIVEVFFGGMDNWDAEYFIYIAEHGYAYEQTMAFFPLLPFAMWLASRTLFLPLTFVMPNRSVILVSGVAINFAAFVAAAVGLYELTMEIFRCKKLSFIAAALFCLNPASVFMSAVYSEAIFACLSLWGMLAVQRGFPACACALFALAAASRSNGTVLCGYLGFYYLKEVYGVLWCKHTTAIQNRALTSLRVVMLSVIECFAVVLPFALFQYYGNTVYCNTNALISEGSPAPSWCQWRLPLPYFYIQEHYWDVGFMRYYQLKQLPNFLLATPMFLLCVYSLFQAALRILPSKYEKSINPVLLPYTLHLLFLILFGTFNMHVQVLTRFVASSSPLIYWFAALALLDELPPNFDVPESLWQLGVAIFHHGPKKLSFSLNSWTAKWLNVTTGQIIVCYFCVYYIVGCVVHCNFLPWT